MTDEEVAAWRAQIDLCTDTGQLAKWVKKFTKSNVALADHARMRVFDLVQHKIQRGGYPQSRRE